MSVTPGQTYTVVIGAGGKGGAVGATVGMTVAGTNGGATSFNGLSLTGGGGATAHSETVNYTTQWGGAPGSPNGQGGAGADVGSNNGGSTPFGTGGQRRTTHRNTTHGSGYGAGGAGGSTGKSGYFAQTAGGNGTGGLLIIEW